VIIASDLSFLVLLILILTSGLYVLCRRGVPDLDAWGRFVSQVIRGEQIRLTSRDPEVDNDK
jgi:hypothetical protein